jgi:DNA-binding NarL/FixJ family response regulator
MTNLYNRVGCADECAEMLINNPEAYALFKAQIAYRRGEIAATYKNARYFLDSHSGLYAILGAGMLLANVAIWSGDINLWYEAKRHICEAPHESEEEREIISLTLAVIDSSIYDNKDFPEWFTSGNFEVLPPDSHPSAKVYFVKYLYMEAFALASGQRNIDDVRGLSLMRLMPRAIEPLITQAVADKTVVPEIYLRLSAAVAYYNSSREKRAVEHIDKAIAMALPDGLYGILAEYVRHFDGILEKRIAEVDAIALERVRELSAVYIKSWTRLSGAVRNRQLATDLTQREREIAKLAAFGYTNKEIGAMKFVSESTVKQTILRVLQKTGIKDRTEIANIL